MAAAVKDSMADIRSTASILIGRYSEAFPIQAWADDVLASLIQNISASSSQAVSQDWCAIEGSLRALKMICEDSGEKLAMDAQRRPLDSIVPGLISLFDSQNPKIRLDAIQSMNALIYLTPSSSGRPGNGAEALTLHMNAFISAIAALSSDPAASVRRAIVQALVLLATLHLSVLQPSYDSICRFMLQALADGEEEVAKEACEFWMTMGEHVESSLAPPEAVSIYFPILIPTLVSRMR